MTSRAFPHPPSPVCAKRARSSAGGCRSTAAATARRAIADETAFPWLHPVGCDGFIGRRGTGITLGAPIPLGGKRTDRRHTPQYRSSGPVLTKRLPAARHVATRGGDPDPAQAPLALDHCRAGASPGVLRRDEASRDRRACVAAGRPRGPGAFDHRRASAPSCMRLGHEPTADCRTRSGAGSTASATSCHCHTSYAGLDHRPPRSAYPLESRITRMS